MKQWNVTAGMAVSLTLLYAGTTTWAFIAGTIPFETYGSAIAPLLTAWGGYLARMLQGSAQ